MYDCDVGKETYNNNVGLKTHNKDGHVKCDKHDALQFNCNQCTKYFTDKPVTNVHKPKDHRPVQFDCDNSDLMYIQEGNSNVHIIRAHEPTKNNIYQIMQVPREQDQSDQTQPKNI
jgi:hypothetical protein